MNAEARLAELKLELPSAPKPVAVYKPLVTCGNLAYVSGHGPLKSDKTMMTGRVGQELDLEAGKAAARQTGLAILATLRSELGSLDSVKRVIKVLGMVNCTPDFRDHPQVINGCSGFATSSAPRTVSAPAARWAWGRCPETSQWRLRRCLKSRSSETRNSKSEIRNPKLEIRNKSKWTKREIQNDTSASQSERRSFEHSDLGFV